MSCSGKPPTSPPDARSTATAEPAVTHPDSELNALADFAGGHWLVPPHASRPPGGQPPTGAPTWLHVTDDTAEAVAVAGRVRALAMPRAAATDAVMGAARAAGCGLLVHDWRDSVMRSLAAGWRGRSHTVMLPGGVVRVSGRGLLLGGPAGVGKSEAALGLIDRGHGLVADDAFLATYDRHLGWTGEPGSDGAGRMAIRGLGLVDVAALFGPEALAPSTTIDLEVILDPALRLSAPGFLGGERGPSTLPGVPCLQLPAQAGRNLPLLLETALRQHA